MEAEIFLFFVNELSRLFVPHFLFWICSLSLSRFALVDGAESPAFEIRPNAAIVPFVISIEALGFAPAEIFLFFEAGGMIAAAFSYQSGS